MKVLLKNAGRYWGMEDVKFPVLVEATDKGDGMITVSTEELGRVGADTYLFDHRTSWPFLGNFDIVEVL